MKRWLLLLLLCIVPCVSGAYYADLTFDVQNDGMAAISGSSNHPELEEQSTSAYTDKEGEMWTFSLAINESFDTFIIAVILPEDAVISYVKASAPVKIQQSSGRQVVQVIGDKDIVQLKIQYEIVPVESYMWIYVGSALIMLCIVVGIFYLIRRMPKSKADQLFLAPRQKDIVTFLEKQKKPVTQKQLEDALGLPKSSVSRNVDALVRRGIVRKENLGMSSAVMLNTEKK